MTLGQAEGEAWDRQRRLWDWEGSEALGRGRLLTNNTVGNECARVGQRVYREVEDKR